MERKKFCAGLIAVAMGLAFSVGGASAYEQGDFAGADQGKLIPYYMAGENMATIIGVDNQDSTADDDVTAGTVNIIEVAVFDATGDPQASGEICLAGNQFGYAVLQEEPMGDGTRVGLMVGVGDMTASIYGLPGPEGDTLGVADRAGSEEMDTPGGEGSGIAVTGYVVVRDIGIFETTANQAENDMDDGNDGCDSQDDPDENLTPKFAAWTILQDVGEGSFFGTEIPTATVADDVDCTTAADCPGLTAASATSTLTVRFDENPMNASASTIYLWLDDHTAYTSDDVAGTIERTAREYAATVHCEGADAEDMMLDVPDRVNVIDASTLKCEGRGVVQITVPVFVAAPDASVAAAWSHISQEGGGFRMNFAGYETP